jgi:hypothetical protein
MISQLSHLLFWYTKLGSEKCGEEGIGLARGENVDMGEYVNGRDVGENE